MWKLRNRACFEEKLIKLPSEIICYACSFLRYWASLQKEKDKNNNPGRRKNSAGNDAGSSQVSGAKWESDD
jgi:hypothetical protein